MMNSFLGALCDNLRVLCG